jgi:hypothetical protein
MRNRNETPETRARWNLKTRYNLTPEQVQVMKNEQDGFCAICDKELGNNFRIDHNHKTGVVRGLLCHRCNLLIAGIEDQDFYELAVAYLMISDCEHFGDMTNVVVINNRTLPATDSLGTPSLSMLSNG